MKTKKFEGYVAWLDILGFKAILQRNPNFAANNYGQLLMMLDYAAVSGSRKIIDGVFYPDESKKSVHVHVMSDTFIFYTDGTELSDLKNLLNSVWWFMPNGYIGVNEDLALRGAITKGEIEIISYSNACVDTAIIFQGKAILDAVELEATVAAGVCRIADDVLDNVEISIFNTQVNNQQGLFNPVIEWEIPIKNNGQIAVEKCRVINWAKSPVDIKSLTNKFVYMIGNAVSSYNIAVAGNTQEFYESIRNNRPPKYQTI